MWLHAIRITQNILILGYIHHKTVERRFSFPLKGQAIEQNGLKGFRNIETDFTEICRVDDRSDKELLRLYALQLITSKTFKSTMVIAIIINLILMILPITLNPRVDWNNSLTIGDQLRIPLSIIENVIGKSIFTSRMPKLNDHFQWEFSLSKFCSKCSLWNQHFGTMDGTYSIYL